MAKGSWWSRRAGGNVAGAGADAAGAGMGGAGSAAEPPDASASDAPGAHAPTQVQGPCSGARSAGWGSAAPCACETADAAGNAPWCGQCAAA